MQARHLAAKSEFTTGVQHIEGKANVVADVLSWVEIDSAMLTLGIDLRELALAQRQDPDAGAIRTTIMNLCFQKVGIGGKTLLCDISQGHQRPWVQAAFCRTVFQPLHSLSYPGAKATARLVGGGRFIWQGLKRDMARWAREFLACQQAKIHRHVRVPLEKVPVPDSQFKSVNIDLVGPLPLS